MSMTIVDPVASEILAKLEEADHASRKAVEHIGLRLGYCIEIGGMLIKRKGELGHGKWQEWFDSNIANAEIAEATAFSIQTARRWMRLAEMKSDGVLDVESGSTVRQAYLLAGLLPASESESGNATDNEDSRILVKFKRLETMLRSELTRHPLTKWTKEERTVWADRLRPFANLYQELLR